MKSRAAAFCARAPLALALAARVPLPPEHLTSHEGREATLPAAVAPLFDVLGILQCSLVDRRHRLVPPPA